MTLSRYFLLLILSLAVVVAACDTPTGNFDRNNPSDPQSVTFDKEGAYDLVFDIHSDGKMLLSWGELEEFIDKVIVKKSLGDSLNFVKVAELESDATQWQDTSNVFDRLMYYKIETYFTRNNTQQKYGEAVVERVIGNILNFSTEVNNENETLDLKWVVDVPFFSYFILKSDYVITENGEKSVELPGYQIENSYSDRDPNISFDPRNYTLIGVIEGGNGDDDIVVEKDLKSIIKPENLDINVINEQDWLLSWEGEPYFSDGIKVSRSTFDEDWYIRSLQKGEESLMDTLLSVDGFSLSTKLREYKISFTSGDTESEMSSITKQLDISAPFLTDPFREGSLEKSITISWLMNGTDVNKVKEYIIEKRVNGAYIEVGRVPGEKTYFTDDIENPDAEIIYRVRTLATYFGYPKEFQYVNNYRRVNYFDTEVTFARSLEISSDGKYLTVTSFIGNFMGNPLLIEIWNIDSRQKEHTLLSEIEGVSDFKVSHDDKYIYYVIPTENAIYRRDFPDGGNPTKIIENASLSGVPVTKIVVSSNGDFLLGAGMVGSGHGASGFVKRWDLDTYDLQFSVSEPVFGSQHFNIALSNDNSKYVINALSLLLKNANNGEKMREITSGYRVGNFTFSPSDKYLSYKNVAIYSILTNETKVIYSSEGSDFHAEKENLIAIWERIGILERDYYGNDRFERVYFYDIEAESRVGVISNANNRGPKGRISRIKVIDSDRVAVARHWVGLIGPAIEIWEKMDTQQWKVVREIYN